MKQPEEVREFKKELSSYPFLQKKLEGARDLCRYCYDLLPGGVRSPSLTEHGHTQMSKETEYRIREEIEKHEARIQSYLQRIREIDEVLALMDEDMREACIDIYMKGRTVKRVCRKHHLSEYGLKYRVNKAIQFSLQAHK